MKLPVIITTRLTVSSENDRDLIEKIYSGTCSQKDFRRMLCYEEQENAGTARLLLTPEMARLFRRGRTSSEMLFAPGRAQVSDYATPHGVIEMEVRTESYALTETPGGGEARMAYQIVFSGHVVSRNTLVVKWTYLN